MMVITNQGGKTPGSDGITFDKKDFGTKDPKSEWRNLGIPCSIDRAYQALFNLALAPVMCEINDKRSS